MTTTDVLVLVGAVASIAWVNWYFFFAAAGAVRSGSGDGEPGP